MSKKLLDIDEEIQLIVLEKTIKTLAAELGMSIVNQTKLMTAARELGRNMILYGRGGTVTVDVWPGTTKPGIRLVFADQGPGIPNLEVALQDGYSSGQGLGLGLPGTKRLVDEFHIESTVGRGTTVTITKW